MLLLPKFAAASLLPSAEEAVKDQAPLGALVLVQLTPAFVEM